MVYCKLLCRYKTLKSNATATNHTRRPHTPFPHLRMRWLLFISIINKNIIQCHIKTQLFVIFSFGEARVGGFWRWF